MEDKVDCKIIVDTHKKYRMPSEQIYIPVFVGAEGKRDIGYQRDDIGENISSKNPSYCELTGLYWAWKNLSCDYMGIVHYRRHFSVKKGQDKWQSILTEEQALGLCRKYDIVLPHKRKYHIESLYSHYAHTHYAEQLDMTAKIIKEKYPDYLDAYHKVVEQTSGYMFNMYIMRKELSDSYCEWLFDLLFELEKRIDMPDLSPFQGRFYGRVSEILFNVWLKKYCAEHEKLKICEIECVHMEPINWWKKGTCFLKAKFLAVKYESGF